MFWNKERIPEYVCDLVEQFITGIRCHRRVNSLQLTTLRALTHWSPDKITAIAQTISNCQEINIGLGNCIAPNSCLHERWYKTRTYVCFTGFTNVKCKHYNDVIMGAIASQITSLMIVSSTDYSDADQWKHQSSALLAFLQGFHWWRVNSPHKWPATQKMFPFDDVIMKNKVCVWESLCIEPGSLLPLIVKKISKFCNTCVCESPVYSSFKESKIKVFPRSHVFMKSWYSTAQHTNFVNTNINHGCVGVISDICLLGHVWFYKQRSTEYQNIQRTKQNWTECCLYSTRVFLERLSLTTIIHVDYMPSNI